MKPIGIELKHLSFAYGNSPNVLDGISLELEFGSSYLIRGNTGSGKSTLLQIFCAMKRPTEGDCLLGGQPVSRWTAPHRDRWRGNMGFAPQDPLLLPHLTVAENIMLPLITQNLTQPEIDTVVREAIEELDLLHLATQRISQCSGGEAQRVSLARAIAKQPTYLFLDEPSSHQDDVHLSQLLSFLDRKKGTKTIQVVTSHDPRLQSSCHFDMQLELSAGQLEVL